MNRELCGKEITSDSIREELEKSTPIVIVREKTENSSRQGSLVYVVAVEEDKLVIIRIGHAAEEDLPINRIFLIKFPNFRELFEEIQMLYRKYDFLEASAEEALNGFEVLKRALK